MPMNEFKIDAYSPQEMTERVENIDVTRLIGGVAIVGVIYWFIYLRKEK